MLRYERGKADWIVRGMPAEPAARMQERLRAFPFFVNNLYPQFRAFWIRFSLRTCVIERTSDDVPKIGLLDRTRERREEFNPLAVVLDSSGILLGAVESRSPDEPAREVMNPAPQTIRPDMTLGLAEKLRSGRSYLLVSSADGKYLGRYTGNPRS